MDTRTAIWWDENYGLSLIWIDFDLTDPVLQLYTHLVIFI